MRTINYVAFYILLLFASSLWSQSNRTVELGVYGGYSLPDRSFNNFASQGTALGARATFMLTNQFGISIDGNRQLHDFENNFDFGLLGENAVAFTSTGSWKNTTFSIGPRYRFGHKIKISTFFLAGISNVSSPDAQGVWATPFNTNDVVFDLSEQNESGFGFTTGFDVFIPLSSKLSLSISPQYVYSSKPITYLIKDPRSAVFTNDMNEELFEPGILAQGDPEERQLDLSHINLNIGLNLSLGGNSKQVRQDDLTTSNRDCLPTVLNTPENNTEFIIESDVRPDYSWQNSQGTSYTFQLLDGDKVVFEKQVEEARMNHSKALEKVYARREKASYSWQVITHYDLCESTLSRKRNISFGNRSGAFHDVTYFECNTPAYLPDGSLNLKGEITFFNNISTTNDLIIDTSTIQVNGGGITFSNTYICPNIPLTPTLIIPPGGSSQLCFDVVLPAGTPFVDTTVTGTINGLSQISNDRDDVPDCNCDVCDSEWYFVSSGDRLYKTPYTGNTHNFRVLDSIRVLGNRRDIRSIKAEIVSVKHVASDPQCYKCVKHDDDMGQFYVGSSGLTPWIQNTTNTMFPNGRKAESFTDANNDNRSNQVVWNVNDINTGIDFTSIPRRFDFPIKLPEASSLECCEHEYEVCIRYTFTDLDCISCDYYMCYTSDGRVTPNGGQGTGVGTSTPSVGVASPAIIKTN